MCMCVCLCMYMCVCVCVYMVCILVFNPVVQMAFRVHCKPFDIVPLLTLTL